MDVEFAKHNPFGGGFEAYRQNKVSYKTINTDYAGKNNAALETNDIVEKGRAYHSAYFEMLGEQGYPGLGLWLTLHLWGCGRWSRCAHAGPSGVARRRPARCAVDRASGQCAATGAVGLYGRRQLRRHRLPALYVHADRAADRPARLCHADRPEPGGVPPASAG
jgi:O-antigen ligase